MTHMHTSISSKHQHPVNTISWRRLYRIVSHQHVVTVTSQKQVRHVHVHVHVHDVYEHEHVHVHVHEHDVCMSVFACT